MAFFIITHKAKAMGEINTDQNTLFKLYEAMIAHSVEIKHLTSSMERILDAIMHVERRLDKIQAILEVERKEGADRGATRNGIVELIGPYWQVIVIGATIITSLLSYFFGVRIRD